MTRLLSFTPLKEAFTIHFQHLLTVSNNQLYVVDIDEDILWDTYINSYPSELRPQFTCTSCKSFIKRYGGIVSIKDDLTLNTIWNFEVVEPFQSVVNNLHLLIKEGRIDNIFRSESLQLGIESNRQTLPDNQLIRWYHLSAKVPSSLVVRKGVSIESVTTPFITNKNLIKRALDELTIDSTRTVLELIQQGSIYRAEEFKSLLESFLKVQESYISIDKKDTYCWTYSSNNALCRIRNSAIGTLLINISEGMGLDEAVGKFEELMGGYKRAKSVFTQKMKDEAQKTIESLGLTRSLPRRLANDSDITINDLLYIDKTSIKLEDDIFSILDKDVSMDPKRFDRVDTISLNDFIEKVLPSSREIELYMDNTLIPRLMTLIAPVNPDAPPITKWKGGINSKGDVYGGNNFTWSYNGSLTDASLKEKVKMAGGKVEGELRCSLEWYNTDDLDIHLYLSNGNHIYFGNKRGNGGHLDIDMNVSKPIRNPVENIIFSDGTDIPRGTHRLVVNNFNRRESIDVGFRVEIECRGHVWEFIYNQPLRSGEQVTVATFTYNEQGVSIVSGIKSTPISKDIWGLKTNQFHRVKTIMYSPNYWQSGNQLGNKHTFFILNGAKAEGPINGFYNEFLIEELVRNHKRVLETLANRMEVQRNEGDAQLSGVGFSSTSKGEFVVKVTGNTTRLLKVVVY